LFAFIPFPIAATMAATTQYRRCTLHPSLLSHFELTLSFYSSITVPNTSKARNRLPFAASLLCSKQALSHQAHHRQTALSSRKRMTRRAKATAADGGGEGKNNAERWRTFRVRSRGDRFNK